MTIVGVSGHALIVRSQVKIGLEDITKDLEDITTNLNELEIGIHELETGLHGLETYLNKLDKKCGPLEDSVLASVKDTGTVENREATVERRMQGCLVRAIRT